jgi:hypothetical protein
MIGAGLLMMTLGAATADPADDLKRDMTALELFLQDQKDHKENCPELKWDQPDIDIYKKELKSQLPEGCKK